MNMDKKASILGHWPVEVKLEQESNSTSRKAKLLSIVMDPEADEERKPISLGADVVTEYDVKAQA